eukprot:gnl/TRDRNA2_/TRDRNA2_36819_c0_seq1.p1 gnl/TRDRNA2_/TRDRNA2_36819_c0~~gnl/TRDRNA2_/TRDRNA2_36819_c0_seq1.p1  ORF type:complete len:122 (-),score=27.48 gnl/TRDRNA2_/TRDRNA2_36819_c0_seq1:763-1128(-)
MTADAMNMLELTVQSLSGSVLATIDAEPHWSLQQLSDTIEKHVPNAPVWRQRLILGTRVLDERDSGVLIKELDLSSQATIQLVLTDTLPPAVESLLAELGRRMGWQDDDISIDGDDDDEEW